MPVNKTWANGDPIAVADYQRWEDSGGLGWYLISAAAGYWTFASATTINVPSGAANFFQKGDKLRLKQGGSFKYFVIVAVTDTLLTVCAGADNTVANANITDIYISRGESPIGWPGKFNLSNPTWTTFNTTTVPSAAAFTNQPPAGSQAWYCKFQNDLCEVFGEATMHATSGGTGGFLLTFVTGELPNNVSADPVGSCHNYSTFKGGNAIFSGSRTMRMHQYDGGTLATNSQVIRARAGFVY